MSRDNRKFLVLGQRTGDGGGKAPPQPSGLCGIGPTRPQHIPAALSPAPRPSPKAFRGAYAGLIGTRPCNILCFGRAAV